MKTALIIIHLVISLVLIIVVLMQQGKQAGLSGAVAGGAETFFGKNKGRTVDAMLKKLTSVVAILFIASSLVLAYVATKDAPAEDKAAGTNVELNEQDINVDTQQVLDEAAAQAAVDAQASENAEADANAETETTTETNANAETETTTETQAQ